MESKAAVHVGTSICTPTSAVTLKIQAQIRYAICVPCGRVFKSAITLKGHLEKKHGDTAKEAKRKADEIVASTEKGVTREVSDRRQLYENAPLRVGKSNTSSLPALEGVEISNGYKCPDCEYLAVRKKPMSLHFQEAHGQSLEKAVSGTDDLWRQGNFSVQSLQGGHKTCYFRVHHFEGSGIDSPVEVDQSRSNTLLRDNVMQIPVHQFDLDFFADACEFESQRMLLAEQDDNDELQTYNDFIAATRVPAILEEEGIDVKDAAKLTGLLQKDELKGEDLVRLSQLYLERVSKYCATSAPSLLETIFPRADHAFEAVGKKTVSRYASHLSDVLAFAARLDSRNGESNRYGTSLIRDFVFCNSTVDDETNVQLLHSFLKQVCLTHRSRSAGVKNMFMRTYFACKSVRASGAGNEMKYRFVEASEISHSLAALQHIILGTALFELNVIGGKDCMENGPGRSDQHVLQDLIRREEDEVLLKVNRNENTPIAYVRTVLNICWAIMKSDTANFKVIPCKSHSFCGFVRGVELSMSFIGKCIKQWHVECRKIMKEELLCNGTYPPGLMDVISEIGDDLQDRSNGYSFMCHPTFTSKSEQWQKWLMREIAENGEGATHMLATPAEDGTGWTEKQLSETLPLGRHRLYISAVQKWLGSCQRLQEKLLLCLHFSSGSPARATEISTFRVENSAFGQRNLYISQNDMITLCRYGKMRKQKGSDTHVLRIPDKVTGELFKTYLLFFRRIESILVGLMFGDEKKRGHMHWAFVRKGVKYTPERIRKVLGSGMAVQGKEISISDARHFFAQMVRDIAQATADTGNNFIEEFEDTGQAQAGHSSGISDRHYGRSIHDFTGLSKRSVERSRLFCVKWHECLFMTGNEWQKQTKQSNIHKTDNDLKGAKRPFLEIEEAIHGLREDFGRCMKRLITADLIDVDMPENGSSYPSDTKKMKMASHAANCAQLLTPKPRNRGKDAARLLPDLRKLMKDQTSNFKSVTQADVTASILEGSEDLLVVMGTGAGKSLCVLLPVFMEGLQSTTIIITPLAALAEEWKKKCRKAGVSAGTWGERRDKRYQIYILAAEHVDNSEYRKFIAHLCSHGGLKRIVYDEAHGAITWDDFRHSMFKARFLLGCASRPVQRVLLSATVPPSARQTLLTAFGMNMCYVYAPPTTRTNLSFSVQVVNGSTVGDGLCSLLTGLCRVLKTEIDSIRTKFGTGRIMIFVLRVSDVDITQKRLISEMASCHVFEIIAYHGRMTPEQKCEAQRKWDRESKDAIKIVVCTSAFGAGIDTNTVRLTVHVGGSSSLVQYAQECGRAGRDERNSKCILLWNDAFAKKQELVRSRAVAAASMFWDKEFEERKLLWWNEMRKWAEDRSRCRRTALFEYLDGRDGTPCIYLSGCNPCDVCTVLSHALGKAGEGGPEDIATYLESVLVASEKAQSSDQPTPRCYPFAQKSEKISDSALKEQDSHRGTRIINHQNDRERRLQAVKLMSSFEDACQNLEGLCTLCVVLRDTEKVAEDDGLCAVCLGQRQVLQMLFVGASVRQVSVASLC